MNLIFDVEFSNSIQIVQNFCANGTKIFFKDGTVCFVPLVQDGGGVIQITFPASTFALYLKKD